MEPALKVYSEEEILKLTSAIGGDKDAFSWLMENCKELAALRDAILFENNTALQWLKGNGFTLLAQFSDAILGDELQQTGLMNYPQKQWAAVVAVVNDAGDDDQAMLWLMKNGFKHFGKLAAVLCKIINIRNAGFHSGGRGLGGGYGIGDTLPGDNLLSW